MTNSIDKVLPELTQPPTGDINNVWAYEQLLRIRNAIDLILQNIVGLEQEEAAEEEAIIMQLIQEEKVDQV